GEFQANALDQHAWQWLTERMSYVQGEFENPDTYKRLDEHLSALGRTACTGGNHLFSLAVADRFFGTAVEQLGDAGVPTETGRPWRRVVIEKPFGHDLASAQ